MAKRFVKVSLATKFRLLLGAAVLAIIVAALVVPWYFMELLAERGIERTAAELTRLRLAEWEPLHAQKDPLAENKNSPLVRLHSTGPGSEGRSGPIFLALPSDRRATRTLDNPTRKALRAFMSSPSQELAIIRAEDDRGRPISRCFRAVRVRKRCMECHGQSEKANRRYQVGQLVGIIDASLPASATTDSLVWWTRGAFVVGVAMAALLAFILMAMIAQRLILRPMRKLRDLTDKVAEGDLTPRSDIQTGDEFQQLGDRFNEMLDAITSQHDKLRAANRASDLKLHEMSESNVTLYQANKVKDEFLANVSHELRTPLNSILGFADLLGDSSEQRIARYGENIRSAARNLLNMINDLLDHAKIQAGKAEVRLEKVSVTDTCRTLVSLMGPMADKKRISLRAELSDDLPLVTTDAGKLQQILYNLLSNAMKFTPPQGKVTISAGRSGKSTSLRNGEEIFVSVADTGPGIAEADQKHIFEKFYQLERTLTKEAGGTGLGLAIAKELTNLLAGRLTVKSSPGHGAVFTLNLPVQGPSKDA